MAGVPAGLTGSGEHRDWAAPALVAVAGVLGLLIALRVRPDTLYDDAAITFRYAARLADGLGFTYNDGDRTGGASAPLYTLVLALGAAIGIRPEVAAAALSVPMFAGAVAVATWLGCRIGGLVAGATTAVVLLTGSVFQTLMLSGMESAFAALLGLCALAALSRGHTMVAAVLVGLAIVNRMDAAALALAVLAGIGAVDRRVPWKEAAATAAVALPWFVFATWYLGSPVPFSATQKLAGRSGTWDRDPTWVLSAITGRHGALVLVLAAASTLLVAAGLRARAWPTGAHLAALLWLAVHVAAYSVLDFGAPYPWYSTVAIPLAAVAAGTSVAALADGVRRHGWSSTWGVGTAVTLVGLLVSLAPGIGSTVGDVVTPPPERTARLLDATRADAGRWVADRSAPGEVVRTCFGWVAYEVADHAIDEVCPLNTREPVDEATWVVDSPGPGGAALDVTGYVQVAEFTRTGPDGVEVASIVYRSE